MRKYKKPIIIVIILTSIFFIVKSRRISQSDFDLLVLLEQNEIMEVCNNQLTAMQKNPNINFDDVEYDNSKYYNYNVSKYGLEICSDTERIKKIAEDKWKDYLKREWKFVLQT